MADSAPSTPSSDTSSNNRRKTSLEFIITRPTSQSGSSSTSTPTMIRDGIAPVFHPAPAPSTPTPKPQTTSLASSSSAPKGKKTLESLPRELLALVAFHLVVDDQGYGSHPCSLLPFLHTSRTIHEAISFDNNPQLYHRLFQATFDYAALDRRYNWMVQHLSTQAGKGKKLFNLFADPRSWAIDYRSRWESCMRMRKVAEYKKVEIPGVCDKATFIADLWNVWFLLTEDDGKNLRFLNGRCHLKEFLGTYYKDNLLKESLVPGYPRETGDKSLAIWCSLFAGIDTIGEDNAAEVDEKIFMLRPYVFACAKYDVTYAPWHHRKLPLCAPDCTDHEPDLTLRSKAMTYKRFGYSWKRVPPHFILGVYVGFMRLLERHSDRVGLKAGSSTFSSTPFEAGLPGLFSAIQTMESPLHDREWQRNTMCQDPHTSQGLPPLTYRGQIQGYWRGKFLFYDFDLYRQILAGDMRGVYTGTFAEQVAEMELKETMVKVREEDVGGKGPLLCAGFQEEGGETDEEQERIQAGYGNELCDDADEVEKGWTKEILISGRVMRGRVRSWDGLVILDLHYSRHVMGRWLWRGYLHTGGYMVGRWRDCFTPENLRGYEGAFGLIRAGDTLYPDHFPKKMEDSLGVNQPTPAAATASTSSQNANGTGGGGGGGGGTGRAQVTLPDVAALDQRGSSSPSPGVNASAARTATAATQ
ncbi:hypothetical protein CI109_101070 [Kwoniella shandongensis]|uniref:F-box domain-containing protein n=1 Tax=Kwoniella shandongensis TaxID=1734106 RepID=A0AAJ8MT73_9TREE